VSQLKNPKLEAVAQGVFMGKTQIQAYRDAGYSGTTNASATKVVHHPDVQMRIAELVRDRHEAQRQVNERALEQESVSKGWIVKRAKFIADRAIRGTKATYDAQGNVTGWQPTGRDDGNAINALKLLAHMGGYLSDKVEVGQPGDFARLSNEELEKELILVGESIGLDPKQVQKAIAGKSG
jgi:hypothetical protein